jgi:predicted amidophosphoribosyltransferase
MVSRIRRRHTHGCGSTAVENESGGAEMAICTTCGEAVTEGARFCNGCGAMVEPTPLVCSHCGAPLRSGSRFCGDCGATADPLAQGLSASTVAGRPER